MREKDGETKTPTRIGKAINQPTHDQAQILFEKRIDPKYILNKKRTTSIDDYYYDIDY